MLVARTFAQNKLALIGVAVVVIIILFSFLGPLIYKTDQINPNLIAVNLGPGGGHPLGTDSSGFDILGRLMKGGQSSIEVGIAVGLVSTVARLDLRSDRRVLRRRARRRPHAPRRHRPRDPDRVPVHLHGRRSTSRASTLLIVLLTIVSWLIPARLVRGETLSLRTREYVQAVQVMGGRSWRIIVRHIIPNTIGVIMVTVTFQIANAILTLAVLQYLGFGLPPTTPDLGLDAVRRHHLPAGRILVAGLSRR